MKLALAAIVLWLTLFGSSVSVAPLHDLKELVFFGDSLVDTENYFKLSGNTIPPSGTSQYYQGRASDGPVYSEQLAALAGLDLNNFAISGATACSSNELTLFPLANSVEDVVNDKPVPIQRVKAAVIINAGGNDLAGGALGLVSDTSNFAQRVASCLLGSAAKLLSRGVRRLAIVEIAPLEATPFFLALPESARLQMKGWRQDVSGLLAAGLTSLQTQYPTARLQMLSFTDKWLNMVANPEAYGLKDSTTACIVCSDPSVIPFLCGSPNVATRTCTAAQLPEHMFFDPTHPTTAAHAIFAKALYDQVTDPAQGGILVP